MFNKLLRRKSKERPEAEQRQQQQQQQQMGCGHSDDGSTKGHKQQQHQNATNENLAANADELSLNATLLIQKWFRRHKAQLEARRRTSWMIYQTIEYSSEASQLQLHDFFNDLLQMAEGHQQEQSGSFAERLQQQQILKEEDDELMELTDFANVEVDRNYKGLQLQFPIGESQVLQLVQAFRDKQKLHARYLLQLLHEVRQLLKSRPNVCHVSSSISKKVTVVGDLHGNLQDLLLIFHKNGFPDITNPYVFNGDFVDRGDCSIETAALLFACALAWPSAVFINRGNHEDHVMNARYGFIAEIQQKYKPHTKKLAQLFGDVFSWTPLATIIDQKVLVVHGGISDKVSIDLVQQLDRHIYLSALRPPVTNSATSTTDSSDWRQVLDLLWSDPKPNRGCRPNTFRGGGSYFGPDITNDFLERHGLSLIVRSHECKVDGWEYCHGNKVLTIFSASNYYEQGSNKGAFARFSAGSHEPKIVQFAASSVAELPPSRRLSAVEEGALRDLRAKVAASRVELMTAFQQLDPKSSGKLRVADWCSVMSDCLQLRLPWRKLRPHLAEASSDGAWILYASTFQRVAVARSAVTKQLPASLAEAVYKNKEQLETIFRIMDKDNSGKINLQEFKESCRLLSRATKRQMSETEVEEMAKAIDLNNDGFIDFNEFLEAFRIVENQQ